MANDPPAENRRIGKNTTASWSHWNYKEVQKHPDVIHSRGILPRMSNQKLNSYLKEIADLCGINKNLTFHLARHIFATTITLANGVPMETVSKLLGHSSIKTTQIYAKVIEKKVSEDMGALKAKLNKSTTGKLPNHKLKYSS